MPRPSRLPVRPLFCAAFALLLALGAPRAGAQALIARSQVLVDTSYVPLIRALYATADSVGVTIVADSSREGQVLGMAGPVRVRVRLERISRTQTFLHLQSDFGTRVVNDGARQDPHVRWTNLAVAAIATPRPGGVPYRFVALVALDPQQPVCTAPPLPAGAATVSPIPDRQVPPLYPDRARQRGLGGYVLLEATISAEGRVACLGAISAMNYGFSDAALSAVREWTFKPGTVDGVPTPMVMRLPMRWRQGGARMLN